jgi:hypothetical protein
MGENASGEPGSGGGAGNQTPLAYTRRHGWPRNSENKRAQNESRIHLASQIHKIKER